MEEKEAILTKIQENLDKQPAIRLQEFYKTQTKELSLKEFIMKFFGSFNIEHDTILKETKEIQTPKGCRRSLGDVYLICKYYYKNCTLEEVATILYKELCVKDKYLRTSYCYQMKKRAFYKAANPDIYDKEVVDEFGLDFKDWLDLLN